jgi:hypothetical protein
VVPEATRSGQGVPLGEDEYVISTDEKTSPDDLLARLDRHTADHQEESSAALTA